jgi:hypothetical protein
MDEIAARTQIVDMVIASHPQATHAFLDPFHDIVTPSRWKPHETLATDLCTTAPSSSSVVLQLDLHRDL